MKLKYSDKNAYSYWMTMYDYRRKIILSDDIVENAKSILFVQYLWREFSKPYLASITVDDFSNIWIEQNDDNKHKKSSDVKDYKYYYNCFFDGLLLYCGFLSLNKKISISKWLKLQMLINRAVDEVYIQYIRFNDYKKWKNKVGDNLDKEDSEIKRQAFKEFEKEFKIKYKERIRLRNCI